MARYLRMLGFDTLYRNDYEDEELARVSSHENRILLTRDRGLLKRSIVTHGYCIRQTSPRQRVIEVLRRHGFPPGPAGSVRFVSWQSSCQQGPGIIRHPAYPLSRLDPFS